MEIWSQFLRTFYCILLQIVVLYTIYDNAKTCGTFILFFYWRVMLQMFPQRDYIYLYDIMLFGTLNAQIQRHVLVGYAVWTFFLYYYFIWLLLLLHLSAQKPEHLFYTKLCIWIKKIHRGTHRHNKTVKWIQHFFFFF